MEEVGKNGRLLGNADIQRLRPKIFEALHKLVVKKRDVHGNLGYPLRK